MKKLLLALFFISSLNLYSQSSKYELELGKPILTDSTSTILIPILYNESLFTSNKLGLWGNYYANVIFYNFKTDSSKKLFEKDCYISTFNLVRSYSYYFENKYINNNIGKNKILYMVKNADLNKNGKIDEKDASVLFVSDIYGNDLKLLTSENENVVEIILYDNQNFALLKMQRDINNDKSFENEDRSYYYIKLDLNSLTFGQKIEISK